MKHILFKILLRRFVLWLIWIYFKNCQMSEMATDVVALKREREALYL